MDHRAYLIDINLSQYFEEEFSNGDKINKYIIDPNRRSYYEKFEEMAEQLFDSISIENTIYEMMHSKLSREVMEQVDKDFTYILQMIIKKIEGSRRGVTHSKQKF